MSNPSLSKVRYNRTTGGENAEVLIAAALAYTTQATLALFQANAADGEVGIYDTTGALVTTALAAGTKYNVVQQRDGFVKTTTTIIYDVNTTRRAPYVAPVKQVTTITFDTSLYTLKTGDDFELALIETTPGNDPYPTWAYDIVIGDTYKGTNQSTAALALTAIVARINDVADLIQKDDVLNGQTPFTASISNSGTVYTIVITAGFFEQHFRVAMRGPLGTYGSVVYTTPFVAGSGYYDMVARLELEGWNYEGVTTDHPTDGASPIEYGYPTSYAVNGLTYNIYHIDPYRQHSAPNATNTNNYKAHIYIITPVPVGGSTGARAASSPDLAIGTVLGFTLAP